MADEPRPGDQRLVQYVGGWDPPTKDHLDAGDMIEIEQWDGEGWHRVASMTYGEYVSRRQL